MGLFFNNYAHGDREVGNVFLILNFDAAKYAANGPDGDVLTEVMRWSLEDGIVVTGDITYNSHDNEPVDDQNPDVLVEMTGVMKAVVMVVGVMCVVWSALLWVFLYVYREAKVVKAAQAKMSMLMVVGGLIAGGRVINAAMTITDASCTTGLWLGHIGFYLVFGTLLVKTWRIYKLLQAGLKKVKISEQYVLVIVGAGAGFLCAYLAILTGVGRPRESEICSLESHVETCLKFCSLEHPEFHSVLFAFEACLLAYGSYLCYGTKGAPDAINESKFIALGKCCCCWSY
jgi:hypothetical protein